MHVHGTVQYEVEGEVHDLEKVGDGSDQEADVRVRGVTPEQGVEEIHQLRGKHEQNKRRRYDDQDGRHAIANQHAGVFHVTLPPHSVRLTQRVDQRQVAENEN